MVWAIFAVRSRPATINEFCCDVLLSLFRLRRAHLCFYLRSIFPYFSVDITWYDRGHAKAWNQCRQKFWSKKNKSFLTPVSSLNEFYRKTIGALKFDPNTLRILTHKNQIKGFHFFEYDLLQWPTEKIRWATRQKNCKVTKQNIKKSSHGFEDQPSRLKLCWSVICAIICDHI